MPNEYGMDLAPNTASSIAVQMNEIKRKPKPYTSKCIDNWEEADYPVSKSTNYSLVVPIRAVSSVHAHFLFQLCQRLCHQSAVVSNCSCYWPELYIPSISDTDDRYTFNMRPCSTLLEDNPDRVCYAETIRQFDTLNRQKEYYIQF